MAKVVRDQLKCGECGCELVRIFHEVAGEGERVGGQGDGGFDGILIVKCSKCGDETKIKPVPSRLTTDGNFCGGWRS